nr:predicted GPI-anchored protein 58 [Aegilops tauschii subsp. strangulata]
MGKLETVQESTVVIVPAASALHWIVAAEHLEKLVRRPDASPNAPRSTPHSPTPSRALSPPLPRSNRGDAAPTTPSPRLPPTPRTPPSASSRPRHLSPATAPPHSLTPAPRLVTDPEADGSSRATRLDADAGVLPCRPASPPSPSSPSLPRAHCLVPTTAGEAPASPPLSPLPASAPRAVVHARADAATTTLVAAPSRCSLVPSALTARCPSLRAAHPLPRLPLRPRAPAVAALGHRSPPCLVGSLPLAQARRRPRSWDCWPRPVPRRAHRPASPTLGAVTRVPRSLTVARVLRPLRDPHPHPSARTR